MNITKKYYAKNRKEWRSWLSKHHKIENEIWLVYYSKDSGKPRVPYNDAVEEALCYGWIDSTMKKLSPKSFAQRFTPRKQGSGWSPMNIERMRRLIKKNKVTKAGLDVFTVPKAIAHGKPMKIAPDILKELKKKRTAWSHFKKFPKSYQRIRIGWIEGSRRRPEVFRTRLRYFLKMTAKNKRFGMVQ